MTRLGLYVEAMSKVATVIIAVFAAGCFVHIYGTSWTYGPMIGAAMFASAGVLSRLAPRSGVALVLSVTYVMPALLGAFIGPTHPVVHPVWILPLLGVICATGRITRWHVPSDWRPLITAWALIVGVSGLITMGREADFAPSLTFGIRLSNTGIGGSPEEIVAWMSTVVAGTLAGLLWLDWLFERFASASVETFARRIVLPLAISAGLSTAIAFAQGLAPAGWAFMNTGFYAYLRRASGGMLDANAYGVVAALWTVAIAGLAMQRSPTRVRIALAATAAFFVIGVWLSASRSSLVILGCGLVAAAGWVAARARSSPRVTRWVVAAALVAIAAGAAATTQMNTGPVRRLMETLPSDPRAFAVELWNRAGFGPAAALMVEEYPLSGAGVGAFHYFVSEYSVRSTGIFLVYDNAQNWYRHQLAELGIAGSLPWMVWLVLLAAFVVRRWRTVLRSPASSALVAALLGFAAASFVGMPGQNPAVAVTVLTFVFWTWRRVGDRTEVTEDRARTSPSRSSWVVALSLVALHAAGTWYYAAGSLRPANRAARGDWPYAYGAHAAEAQPGGGEFRWTAGRAVIVVDAKSRWMRLTVRAAHPDIEDRPVRVRLWCDGVKVLDQQVASEDPIIKYLILPERRARVVIDSDTSRVWNPRDFGRTDDRELGAALAWDFLPTAKEHLESQTIRIR